MMWIMIISFIIAIALSASSLHKKKLSPVPQEEIDKHRREKVDRLMKDLQKMIDANQKNKIREWLQSYQNANVSVPEVVKNRAQAFLKEDLS